MINDGQILENWNLRKLSTFCCISSGGTPARDKANIYFGGNIPWIKSGELENKPISRTEETITEHGLKNSSAKIFPKNTVLVALYGATVGKTGILEIEAATNQAIAAVIPDNKIADYKFLFFFLRHYSPKLLAARVGGAQPNISQEILKNIQISLPPLPIQKKITAILEKADAAWEKRRQANQLIGQFLQSAFLEMFGDPVINPMKFEMKKLGDVAKINMGQSPPGDSYNDTGEGIPLLNGPTEFGVKSPTEKQWTIKYTKLAKKGEILFCVRGATAGRMNWADKEYCIGRGLASISSLDVVLNEYVYFILLNKYKYFQNLGQGSTFINLSRDMILDIKIPVPPLSEQQKFAVMVEKVESLRARQRQSEQELENLFNSLMQRAFKGEL